MKQAIFERLESRQHLSVSPSATATIVVTPGTYKGSSVSTKGFTSRLTITLGKQHSNNTVTGTFFYLQSFDFGLHLRLRSDNTFRATIATGIFSGTLIDGRVTTADKGTIIDLSGTYSFSNAKGTSDTGKFLVRS